MRRCSSRCTAPTGPGPSPGGAHCDNARPMARRAVDPNVAFPDLEQEVLERWRERDVFAESLRRRKGARAVRLLRGPADGERAAGRAPRPRARLQGHLPALQDDARLLRRAQGRLGLPRPAGRDRRRAAARDQEQGRDRGVRHRRVQRALPRVGLRVPRGLEPADRAHRLLGRPGATPTARSTPTTSSRCGGRCARSTTRACSTRATGSSRTARAAARRCRRTRSSLRLRGRRRPVGLRALPGDRGRRPAPGAATSCSCGRRRRGRSSPTPRSRSTPS